MEYCLCVSIDLDDLSFSLRALLHLNLEQNMLSCLVVVGRVLVSSSFRALVLRSEHSSPKFDCSEITSWQYFCINTCFRWMCGLATAKTPQFPPDFIKWNIFFLSLRVNCALCHVMVHRFSIAAVLRMCARRHVPAHAEAQCCFKSFALRSCQCSSKTRYGLEFWSLDLASARVHFLGRIPALMSCTF